MTAAHRSSPERATDTRHLLVLGVGPGIGAAVVRRFAREGFRVTMVARSPGVVDVLADEIRASGGTADVVRGDASDPEALRAILEPVYAGDSPPGVLVYNAALLTPSSLLSCSGDELATAYAVDVVSAVVAAQVAVPHMRAGGAGTVVFTGGGLADVPYAAYATLSLGKTGIRAAATMLAAELEADGIHVASITVTGAVAPGTPFDPDRIAELYWAVHTQAPDQWEDEYRFDGT